MRSDDRQTIEGPHSFMGVSSVYGSIFRCARPLRPPMMSRFLDITAWSRSGVLAVNDVAREIHPSPCSPPRLVRTIFGHVLGGARNEFPLRRFVSRASQAQ